MSRPEDVTRVCAEMLNELLRNDPKATQQLFDFSAICSPNLEKHPSLIVREAIVDGEPQFSISTLGVLNSILEKLGQKKLCAVVEDEKNTILMFKPYRAICI